MSQEHGFTASGKSCATSAAATASTFTIVPGTTASKCDKDNPCTLATDWTSLATTACSGSACSAVCNTVASASCVDTAIKMAYAQCTVTPAGNKPSVMCGPTATCQSVRHRFARL